MPVDMKKKIAEAALRLLTEKKARKLTVKDIVEECHIYHRYFRSDLLCEDREIYGFRPAVSLISGIFSIMAGVMLLVYPGAGRWVMVLLLPLWFIAHCVSRLSHLNFIRVTAGEIYYWFALIVNIIGIILGIMMIARPMLSLFSAGFLIGTYLILLGVDSIMVGAGKLGSR